MSRPAPEEFRVDEETRLEAATDPSPGGTVFGSEDVEVPPAETTGGTVEPMPTPPPRPQGARSASPRRTAESAPSVRDRIVILGRRNAGKTIFLARLYERLWKSTGSIHMRALDGNDHLFFMESIRVLGDRVWPPATGSSTRVRLEVLLDGRPRTLCSLDYSGEVFRRAFLEQVEDADTAELLDHLDRAAAVILLVDPGLVLHGTPEQVAEDEFGMTSAVRRIRRGAGGASIPIALVLTKLDIHGRLVRECGGLVGFVKTHMFPLMRALHRVRVFGCVAVRSREDALGQQRPDLSAEPLGLLEPLEHCLRSMPEVPAPAAVPPPPRPSSAPREGPPPTSEESSTGRLVLLAAILVVAGVLAGFAVAWALGFLGPPALAT